MDSPLTSIGLPAALAVIMFGLGLSLTLSDFARVRRHPRAVVIALVCQVILLPAVCFGLVLALNLPGLLAVGMMLLAASPGGTTANLYSHLFRGDVALNVSLTALNSVIAVITLPLITNLSIAWFDLDASLSMNFRKFIEVLVIVLVPVAIGMWVRASARNFADAMNKPVRIASAVLLLVMVLGVMAAERENLGGYLARVGVAATLFCAISIALGYFVPRAFGVKDKQAVASSFEIGIHNATLAIYVAENALNNTEVAVPGAVYGVVMFFVAFAWGVLLTKVLVRQPAPAAVG